MKNKMKRIIIIFIFLLPAICLFSQSGPASNKIALNKYVWSYAQADKVPNTKLPIDFTAIDNWQKMSEYLDVSNDGKYFAYAIECSAGSPLGPKRTDSVIVQATNGTDWRYAFMGWEPYFGQPGFFAANNTQYIIKRKDSLCFLMLGNNKVNIITNVSSYKSSGGLNQWMAYQTKADNNVVLMSLQTGLTRQFKDVKLYAFDKVKKWFVCETNQPEKQLIIYNLQTSREQTFPSAKSWLFSPGGNKIIVNTGKELQYNNFTNQTTQTVYSLQHASDEVLDMQFDAAEEQVIFTVRNNSNKSALNSIWYYQEGMNNAIAKINSQSPGLGPDQVIESSSFSDNGQYILVGLSKQPIPLAKAAPGAAQLDVWSYKDLILQTSQANSLTQNKTINAIIGLKDGQVKWMGNENEQLSLLYRGYAIIKRNNFVNAGDRFWENSDKDNGSTNWLINLENGKRILLPVYNNYYWFSPGSHYLVYFDSKQPSNYFSYDLLTGKTSNISAGVTTELNGLLFESRRNVEKDKRPYGLVGWIEKDNGLLVYDNRDIWQLDLTGQKKAINLTNGYGIKNDIILRLFNPEKNGDQLPVLKRNEALILLAHHASNKTNGFYRTKFGAVADPELLWMGTLFTHFMNGVQDGNVVSNNGFPPVKAQHDDNWIVQRQAIDDAPNYFVTKDFKSFKRLTNLQPNQGHKWLTEELHTFLHLDGKTGQGILYKPDDFDSSKKYPALIAFYGRYSNNMYQFPTPYYNIEAITQGKSPAWFTNNDYLVFTPDIYISPNKVGPESYNVIEGAARYLKSLRYVDTSGLGCASHSSSAKQGAYIFTHSKSFSATAISEGFLYANMINVALSGPLESAENGFQFGNLYGNKASWIDHTTVLNADKAISPLLLFCNKKSIEEYQNQTLQLYMALRRQDKKVWWLKYDKGDHNLWNMDEQKDYTIRYTQYFDHYLKKAPAPRWMTQGVPNALRGVEARYELDPFGTCDLPNKKECLICQAWNKQYQRTPAMFDKPISEWSLDKDIQQELNNKISAERKRLDTAGATESKRILDILKNGYPEDKKSVKNKQY